MPDHVEASSSDQVHRKRTIALALVASGAVILIDQVTKYLIESNAGQWPLSVQALGCEASISLQRNSGAFLSLGASLGELPRLVLFSLLPIAASILSLGYALSSRPIPTLQRACAALIEGGGAGNFLDRVVRDGQGNDILYLG